MVYQKNLEPMSKAELAQIPCFRYINEGVHEHDLQELDALFLQDKKKPLVYQHTSKGMSTFWAEHCARESVQVDWRVYRTWSNTFHLRYKEILLSLGLKVTNPFFNPETQWLIATTIESNQLTPLTLKEALTNVDALHVA